MTELTNEQEIVAFIKDNPVMILSTVGESHTPHGAAVYVSPMSAKQLYFVTKTDTLKYKNLVANPNVSVTIVNAMENSCLQGYGIAKTQVEPQIIEMVMGKMAKIYSRSPDWLPPLAKIHAGPYQVVGITLTSVRLANFKSKRAGAKNIFKEI